MTIPGFVHSLFLVVIISWVKLTLALHHLLGQVHGLSSALLPSLRHRLRLKTMSFFFSFRTIFSDSFVQIDFQTRLGVKDEFLMQPKTEGAEADSISRLKVMEEKRNCAEIHYCGCPSGVTLSLGCPYSQYGTLSQAREGPQCPETSGSQASLPDPSSSESLGIGRLRNMMINGFCSQQGTLDVTLNRELRVGAPPFWRTLLGRCP